MLQNVDRYIYNLNFKKKGAPVLSSLVNIYNVECCYCKKTFI